MKPLTLQRAFKPAGFFALKGSGAIISAQARLTLAPGAEEELSETGSGSSRVWFPTTGG